CLLSLGGCEASWQEERNEKALCEEVFTAFFENTYRANNQIVEVSGHGVTPFTEYIDEDKGYIAYEEGEMWSFILDGSYFFAMQDEEESCYVIGEDYYESGRFVYRSYLDMILSFEEEATNGVAYNVITKGKGRKENFDEAEMVFTIESEENSIEVVAKSSKGLVTSASLTLYVWGNKVKASSMNFKLTYGKASIALPDISTWVRY
ncbi:MAG: hypothetical protein J6328_01625, partial [Bacilli bacterium]|nr:hypothetical protein [Bacilli bacterium]